MTARSRSATTNSNASIVSIGRKEKEITTSLLLVCFFYMVTASVAAASFIKIVTMEGFSKRELKLRTLFTSISVSDLLLISSPLIRNINGRNAINECFKIFCYNILSFSNTFSKCIRIFGAELEVGNVNNIELIESKIHCQLR